MRQIADGYRAEHRRVIRKPKAWRAEVFRERMFALSVQFEKKLRAEQYHRFLPYIAAAADRFFAGRAIADKAIEKIRRHDRRRETGKRKTRSNAESKSSQRER